MELNRKPYQGVFNIIRFNWHFYLIAGIVLFVLMLTKSWFPLSIQRIIFLGTIATTLTILISLIVSYYIYDLSNLYQLNWLDAFAKGKVLNINAGFDETSVIIEHKFNDSVLTICDFYDPEKHTEISIKRARNAYPPHPQTISVKADELPFPDNTFDKSLAILSAHEIRNEQERVQFFKELKRVIKPSGQILVTEHLRDLNNFLAYNVGCFHFYSKASWLNIFNQAALTVKREIKITPFITTFILEKNGNTL